MRWEPVAHRRSHGCARIGPERIGVVLIGLLQPRNEALGAGHTNRVCRVAAQRLDLGVRIAIGLADPKKPLRREQVTNSERFALENRWDDAAHPPGDQALGSVQMRH